MWRRSAGVDAWGCDGRDMRAIAPDEITAAVAANAANFCQNKRGVGRVALLGMFDPSAPGIGLKFRGVG